MIAVYVLVETRAMRLTMSLIAIMIVLEWPLQMIAVYALVETRVMHLTVILIAMVIVLVVHF